MEKPAQHYHVHSVDSRKVCKNIVAGGDYGKAFETAGKGLREFIGRASRIDNNYIAVVYVIAGNAGKGLLLTAAIILWIAAVTVDCIRYEYARWLYKEAAKNLSEDESLMFSFTSRIWGIGFHIYGFYKWLWVLGWGACGMVLAILWPEKKRQALG